MLVCMHLLFILSNKCVATSIALNIFYCTFFIFLGDEDNGEQGAWFVLSALGLFSTVPGSPHLVLGSPIFRHVRIWRGKSCKNPLADGTFACDYSDVGVQNLQVSKNIHSFPLESSYLDIVALGTAPDVTSVTDITFNQEHLPPPLPLPSSTVDQNHLHGLFHSGSGSGIFPSSTLELLRKL